MATLATSQNPRFLAILSCMKRLVHQPTTPGQGIVCGVEPNIKSQVDFWFFFFLPQSFFAAGFAGGRKH